MESSPQPEIVVAVVGRTALSGLLTALHRHGYGHVTRVLDPARSDVAGQLRRAGVAVPPGLGVMASEDVGVMVSAPARTRAASELLVRSGASAAWEVERTAPQQAVLLGPVGRKVRTRSTPSPEAQQVD